MTFHQQTAQESLASLKSSLTGIAGVDALARLQQYGPNELWKRPARRRS